MTWTIWMAGFIVLLTIAALLKRIETRLVLFVAGLAMALFALSPQTALGAFVANMTNKSLITSICSSMGFAAVIAITRCDVHFVGLMVKPLGRLGIFLLPFCMLIASFVAIAIPSAAGCAAALGPTMIPLMVRAGFKPAIAGAAIIGSITPSTLSPGSSHNVWIAKISDMDVMDLIVQFAPQVLTVCALNILLVTAMVFVFRDYKKNKDGEGDVLEVSSDARGELPEHPNVLMALAPVLPIIILFLGATALPILKMSIAEAMIYGVIFTFLVSRADPQQVAKEFFNGMGSGYAKILGIIIAAGVFAAGLRAAGVVDVFVNYLTHAQEVAKLGGALGPFVLALLTGSGDAAAFAFNEAVTPHAAQFGLTVDGLGYLAALAGGVGRPASPLCGGLILVAGIAAVSPVEVAKRTAPAMVLCLIALYILI